MEPFTPILSSLTQVFSLELLKDLDSRMAKPIAEFEWGANRVVDLRNKDTAVKTQWNGTCSTFAVIGALENILGGVIDLSERSLWNEYGTFSTDEAVNASMLFWVMDEKYWPQNQSILNPQYEGKGRYKLNTMDYLDTDAMRVVQSIDNGFPCVVALSTPRDLLDGLPQVEATSSFVPHSGHAICISGYKVENGAGYFLAKNSWGTANGINGYQYVAFDLFNKAQRHYAVYWSFKEVIDRGEQGFDIFMEKAHLLLFKEPLLLERIIRQDL